MSPRQLLLDAIRRRREDHVPLALQFTPTTLDAFRRHTGATDPYDYFDLPYRHVAVRPPRRLPDFRRWFEGRVPDWSDDAAAGKGLVPFRGSSYFRMGDHNTALNEWGEYRVFDESGDYHRKVYPLGGRDCSVRDVEAFPLPDTSERWRYDGLEEEIAAVHDRGLAAVVSWEMTIFEKAWRIRGLEELLTDFCLEPEVAERLLDRIVERTTRVAVEYAKAGVDIVQLGDDIGSQNAMLIGPELYRRFLKPRMAALIEAVRSANPEVLVFYHTDGVVTDVVPDLIEIGVDILNPVQRECMDIGYLKREYGSHLSFWGGLSVQQTLPFGTTEEVAAETREIVRLAGTGGGLVIAPGHLIERDVPMANVMAFVETVRSINAKLAR